MMASFALLGSLGQTLSGACRVPSSDGCRERYTIRLQINVSWRLWARLPALPLMSSKAISLLLLPSGPQSPHL